jgi:hypothetical protein
MIGTQEAKTSHGDHKFVQKVKDIVVTGIILQKAKDIVSGIISHAKEAISNALNKNNSDEGDHLNPSDVAQSAHQDLVDYLPDLTSETEVHGVIQQSVVDTLQDSGVAMMQWIADPGACQICQDLAESDPVPVDGEFQDGITCPPMHPRCRCNVVPVN